MRLSRRLVWQGGRVYVRYSKAINRQVTTVRRDVERVRQLAVDPLAFKFDFDFNDVEV